MTEDIKGRTILVLVLLMLGTGWLAAEPLGEVLRIRGNHVFNDESYLAILQLKEPVRPDAATAKLVREKLQSFLRRAGYSLAKVEVACRKDHLLIQVDEGRLEKIVFMGTGSLRALSLKLELSLPHHVFNKPYLDRQLKRLSKNHGLPDVQYELVPVRDLGGKHHGPQLGEVAAIKGYALVRPSCAYELRIRVSKAEWDVGPGLDLGYDFPDGLELGLGYKGQGLFFDDDRWRARIRGGLKLRSEIVDEDPYLAVSRAIGELRYYTPALVGRGFRPFLILQSDLLSRQRKDLMLEIFYSERLEGSLNLGYEFVPGLMLSMGGGVQEKFIFGLEPAEGEALSVEDGRWFRPFITGRMEFVFDTRVERRDRRHLLTLEGRQSWVDGDRALGKLDYRYHLLLEFGWHDLVVASRGVWLWGDVLFDDEEPVGGRYLRGVFGGRNYVQQVGNLSLEFRFSLSRDLYKLGIFHDLAFFGELDRTAAGGEPVFRVANSFGLGFHALILDLLQFDLYYGVGFGSDDEFDHGVAASLKKVF